ncbi:MAG TPA: hypothetical protein PLB91_10955 [Spirochaetales bacterium]|nr:hypothetical protein [Spirochaetales bacterium]HRY53301.1 hypothetical protein [Spirochaetia bacterium]
MPRYGTRPPGRRGPRALAAILALAAALPAFAAGEKEMAEAVDLPPVPRLVVPLPAPPAPPTPADPSWLLYEEGRALYGEKRFGEALQSFKKAVEARAARSDEAVARIDAALADKDAGRAQGSIRALVGLLASRDLVSSELARIRAEAGGSLLKEMSAIASRRVSGLLDSFLRAAKLVVEQRGGARIGDSLAALRAEAAAMRYYPEAEMAIGRIYRAEGELGLAELQIRRALDLAASLDVPEDRYAMLEELAEVYRAEDRLRDYELALREVADEAELFGKRQEYLRLAMERTLARDGIDKFMTLYRVEDAFARSACSKLGELYLRNGRTVAVIYLAAAVNMALTRQIAGIREKEPGFAYRDLRGLLGRIGSDAALSRYAEDSGLYRDMVNLGEALARGGNRESARELWSAVAQARGAGAQAAAARAALARPALAAGAAQAPRP